MSVFLSLINFVSKVSVTKRAKPSLNLITTDQEVVKRENLRNFHQFPEKCNVRKITVHIE